MVPRWRQIEQGAYLALLLVLLCVLAGCSTTPMRERELLLAMERVPIDKAPLIDAYVRAGAVARADPTPANMLTYADAGNTINAVHCSAWLERVTLAEQGLVLSDHNLAVVSALTTAIAGIANWASSSVAALGAAQVAVNGFSNNLHGAIGRPASYAVQSALLGAFATCSDQLLARAPTLKPSQVVLGVDACRRTCSAGAASEIATQSLSAAQITVQPGGALRAAVPTTGCRGYRLVTLQDGTQESVCIR